MLVVSPDKCLVVTWTLIIPCKTSFLYDAHKCISEVIILVPVDKNTLASLIPYLLQILCFCMIQIHTCAGWGENSIIRQLTVFHLFNEGLVKVSLVHSWFACCFIMHEVKKTWLWFYIYSLPLPGYGARWTYDGSQFRGFLEPQMVDGHDVGWRHWELIIIESFSISVIKT